MADKKYCGRCVHAGKPFWMPHASGGLHVHCEHPDVEISGEPGWDSLRRYKDVLSCSVWKKRDRSVKCKP